MAAFDSRPLVPADADFLCALMNEYDIRAAIHLRATALGYWRRSVDFWSQNHSEANFVLTYRGQDAGWLSLGGAEGDRPAIKMLAVTKRFWRMGVATFGISRAEEFFAGLGHERMRVQTTAANAAALGLYKKAGFVIVSQGDEKSADGLWRSAVVLEKSFARAAIPGR